MKSGFVSIIGRPNVGKSTLLNAMIGTKLSIVTHKSQTTRNNVKGIYNAEGVQIVFIDTPGIHKPVRQLSKEMNSMAYGATHSADVMILVVDASLPFGTGDEYLLNHIKVECPLIIVFNKIDETNIIKITALKDKYKAYFPDADVVETVGTEGVNVDLLIKTIVSHLEEGPAYYPIDQISDRTIDFQVSELIREKVLELLNDEVPHSIAITIESFKREGKKVEIDAAITVEKDSQKGIVIGKGGQMIKRIGTLARKEIEKALWGDHVVLNLRVRVKEDWRDNQKLLSEFGYSHKKN